MEGSAYAPGTLIGMRFYPVASCVAASSQRTGPPHLCQQAELGALSQLKVSNRTPADSGGGQGGAKAELNRRLYVGNLSWNVTWGTLKDHFRSAGNGAPAAAHLLQASALARLLTLAAAAVLYADVLRDREGRSKVSLAWLRRSCCTS